MLASSSPRRRELLTRAGIRFNVLEPPEDASIPPGVCADLAVQLIARQKAVAVAEKQPNDTYVLAADTLVVGPRGPLGKPHTPERAREMLNDLRGRRHTVVTGVCAVRSGTEDEALGVSRSAVKMHDFSDEDISRYVASGEPLDRAGAYAIQGGGGDLVEAVAGRVDTVIGLDVKLALQLLTEVGYPHPLPRPSDVSLAPPRVRRPLTPMRTPSRV
ncbi:MAG: nucleoside triphosphate pyrophosphatase [Candidatus Dormibacteria bacterium]